MINDLDIEESNKALGDQLAFRELLTRLQPVVPRLAVVDEGSWRPHTLLTEHLVALLGGQKDGDDPRQQHTAANTEQPPPHGRGTGG